MHGYDKNWVKCLWLPRALPAKAAGPTQVISRGPDWATDNTGSLIAHKYPRQRPFKTISGDFDWQLVNQNPHLVAAAISAGDYIGCLCLSRCLSASIKEISTASGYVITSVCVGIIFCFINFALINYILMFYLCFISLYFLTLLRHFSSTLQGSFIGSFWFLHLIDCMFFPQFSSSTWVFHPQVLAASFWWAMCSSQK